MPLPNDRPPILRRPVALLFGDSLTERGTDSDGGWVAAVTHHFGRKLDILNRGFGGYNTRWALRAMPDILKQAQQAGTSIELLTLFFGANDAAMPDRSSKQQHVPVAEYSSNLEAMVKLAKQAGVRNILLITPPPVDDTARMLWARQRSGIPDLPAERTLEFTRQYARACIATGQRLEVPVLDLFAGVQEQLPAGETDPRSWGAYFLDGLHFTPPGNRLVAQLLLAKLDEAFGSTFSLDLMSNQLPWWDKWPGQEPDSFWKAFEAAAAAGEGTATKG